MRGNFFDTIITNVTLVHDKGMQEDVTIGVADGLISFLDVQANKGKKVINGRHLHAFAGIVDSHVHLRDMGAEHKEDFTTGSRAAIMGGVTCVMDMPNNEPAIISLDAFRKKCARAKERFHCDYGFYLGASIANWNELKKWQDEPACVGVKLFMGSSTGSLLVAEDSDIEKIVAGSDCVLAVHAEDEPRLEARLSLRQAGDYSSHSLWRDAAAAKKACERLCAMVKLHHPLRPVHILHVSTQDELQVIGEAQKDGLAVSAEATPHHLTLCSEEAYETLGGRAVVNPPLRARHQRQALWKGIEAGIIKTIGSDHAPHLLEEKKQPYPHVPSGVPSVGLSLSVMLTHHAKGRISLPKITELMSLNPARLFKLSGKGALKSGYDADIVLVDINAPVKNERPLLGKAQWSPYEDMNLRGRAQMVFLRGEMVVQEGQHLKENTCLGRPLLFET